MEHKQVCIASDDMRCAPADCERKELVVFGIATGSYFYIDINPHCFSRQRCKKAANVLLVDVTAELLAVKNLKKLSQNGIGEQNRALPLRSVHCHPGLRPR